jgi:isoquinoline 1-oxidoreductase
MLYAKILRPPAHNAKLISIDTSAAEQIEGVHLVQYGNLIAVLHQNPDEAEHALQQMTAEFDEPEQKINNKNIFEYLQSITSQTENDYESGSLETGIKQSLKYSDSTFYNYYVAHAPIEPHAVVADVRDHEVKIWASSQTPFRVRSLVAETLSIPEEKVHVITPFLGGGFGGKKAGLDIVQATLLSKKVNKPVQVALTRKEEFFYDSFRPAAVIKLKTGINAAGRIMYWDYDNFFAGSRSSEPIYNIPHYRVQSRRRANRDDEIHPFDVGAWRGPGSNTNVFAIEYQIDILAQMANMDPLTFRMKNLTDKRMLRVLKAAADKFGNAFSKGPSGKGLGIACTNYLNTYVATMAQVDVDKSTGDVRIKHLVCAQDMGEIINPQGAKLQIEGGLTMGIGYALSEEILFEGGKILVDNFDTYEITRFSNAPQIDVVLIDNNDLPPQGCGEPAITTTGAVIANAIYDACGARLFTLPMTPERIRKVL